MNQGGSRSPLSRRGGVASRLGPALTLSWRVKRASARLPDSLPRGLSPATASSGASPDKGRLEPGSCPSSSDPTRADREQPIGTDSQKSSRPDSTPRGRRGPQGAKVGAPTPAQTRPSSGARASRPCRHTWRGLASTHGSGSRGSRRRGLCHPLATAGGGRAPASSFAQACSL